MSKTRTWQDNAAVCALMDGGEGWPFARHIACSVRRGTGGPRLTGSIEPVKTSANRFAEEWGTSRTRVIRHLDAWDKAAEQGLCTPSTDLNPTDAPTTAEPDVPWDSIYDASKSGGRPRDSRPEDAAMIVSRRGADAFVKALTKKQRADLARSLAQPDAVITALDDDEFVAKVVEEMTPQQRNHVRREVNVQEIKRIDESRKDEKIVEKGIEEQLVEEMSEVTTNIYVPLSNARRTLAQVNGAWNKFDGAIDLERVERKVSGIRAEVGVLEMYLTGMPFPAENGIPE